MVSATSADIRILKVRRGDNLPQFTQPSVLKAHITQEINQKPRIV